MYVRLDGSMSVKKRSKVVDRFNDPAVSRSKVVDRFNDPAVSRSKVVDRFNDPAVSLCVVSVTRPDQ